MEFHFLHFARSRNPSTFIDETWYEILHMCELLPKGQTKVKISAHFSLREFDCKDGTPYPKEWIGSRLRLLCTELEKIRHALGDRPIEILSGYRTPEYNRKIGGARRSMHLEGKAADIRVKGMEAKNLHALVLEGHRTGAWKFGGLGGYAMFVHVDIRPSIRLIRWKGSRVAT